MFSVKWLFWKELGFASAGSGVLVLANTLLGGSGLLGMPAALAQAGEDGKNTQLHNLKWDVRWQWQWYPENEEPLGKKRCCQTLWQAQFLLSLTRMSFCMKSFLFVALSPCHIQKMLCDRFDWCRKKLTSFFELFGTLEHRGPRKLEDSCNIRRFGIVWVGMFEVFLLMLSVLSVFLASLCSFLLLLLLLMRQATRWGWFSWRSSAVALRSDVTCCSALHEGQVLEVLRWCHWQSHSNAVRPLESGGFYEAMGQDRPGTLQLLHSVMLRLTAFECKSTISRRRRKFKESCN